MYSKVRIHIMIATKIFEPWLGTFKKKMLLTREFKKISHPNRRARNKVRVLKPSQEILFEIKFLNLLCHPGGRFQ